MRVLAPYDPDDELSRRLHRGARPQQRAVPARSFVSLGRTVGVPANGAVSNLCAERPRRCSAMRDELRDGRLRRAAHPRAGRAVPGLGRALLARDAAARGHLPHLLGEHAHQRHRRGPARRAPAHEPPARAHRGLARPPPGPRGASTAVATASSPTASTCSTAAEHAAAPAAQGRCGSCSSGRPSNARACRCCCRPSRRCASRSRRRSRSSARARRRSRT